MLLVVGAGCWKAVLLNFFLASQVSVLLNIRLHATCILYFLCSSESSKSKNIIKELIKAVSTSQKNIENKVLCEISWMS